MDLVNRWTDVDHALRYLSVADTLPHRTEGEAVLLESLPVEVRRVLDLGCGDGRTLALVLTARPGAGGIGLDFNPEMLERARSRFEGDSSVEVHRHDLDDPLPPQGDAGPFDVVVSSFAIHHVADHRKRVLFGEVFGLIRPGGAFLNLEHVASPDTALHREFLDAVGVDPADDDPSNKLAPVEDQLTWMREVGFVGVDCLWKWRELALLSGRVP